MMAKGQLRPGHRLNSSDTLEYPFTLIGNPDLRYATVRYFPAGKTVGRKVHVEVHKSYDSDGKVQNVPLAADYFVPFGKNETQAGRITIGGEMMSSDMEIKFTAEEFLLCRAFLDSIPFRDGSYQLSSIAAVKKKRTDFYRKLPHSAFLRSWEYRQFVSQQFPPQDTFTFAGRDSIPPGGRRGNEHYFDMEERGSWFPFSLNRDSTFFRELDTVILISSNDTLFVKSRFDEAFFAGQPVYLDTAIINSQPPDRMRNVWTDEWGVTHAPIPPKECPNGKHQDTLRVSLVMDPELRMRFHHPVFSIEVEGRKVMTDSTFPDNEVNQYKMSVPHTIRHRVRCELNYDIGGRVFHLENTSLSSGKLEKQADFYAGYRRQYEYLPMRYFVISCGFLLAYSSPDQRQASRLIPVLPDRRR
jgi:hypothetical protein